jgi:phage baseplate assembly protein W
VPGQKILNPFFGLNLIQYIFQPLSEALANNIGNDILKGLTSFEPRVNVERINVAVDEPNAQYVVTLIVSMPTIKTDTSFKLVGTLSNLGFRFIND